ncbi:hypothetical protein Tco_0899075 [Tanacetum coccineum]
MILDREAMYDRIALTNSEDMSAAIKAHVRTLEARVATLIAQTSSLHTYTKEKNHKGITNHNNHPTSTPVTEAQLRKLIERGVAAVLAERDADRSRNSDDNHDSGTSGRRQASTVRECTYTNFLKCQPMNFKGTEGVIGLTQWLEKMESIFHISNYTVAC